MTDYNELQLQILDCAINLFNSNGFKFTMDDIARSLSISKKTIYTVFSDKEALFLTMVDYLFGGINDIKQQIMDDDSLTLLEKIERILGAMPECYRDIDFRRLYELKDKFPKIYRQVEIRLESGWENTFELLNMGIEEGLIKNVNLTIVKTMMEATLEQFFQRDILISSQMTYQGALEQVVAIILGGIVNHDR